MAEIGEFVVLSEVVYIVEQVRCFLLYRFVLIQLDFVYFYKYLNLCMFIYFKVNKKKNLCRYV